MWCLLFAVCICAVYLRIVVYFALRSRQPQEMGDFDQVYSRDCQKGDGAGSQEPCRIHVAEAAVSAEPTRIFSGFGSGDIGASSICRTKANFSSSKVRSYMRLFFIAKRTQKRRALVCLLRDTLGDLPRSLNNQAMLDLMNPLFELR